MQQLVSKRGVSAAPMRRSASSKLIVQASVSAETPAFKLPAKAPLPKDAEGVKAFIAKSHEMHGQGRCMYFSLTGAGRRATAGTYLAHADPVDWNVMSTASMDSYNIFS
ncbi:hypothetical protein Agub_g12542 [Astrephomene gubernaculifera]|uniref:Uncharacterized protein n=1 Tax=Astrephomene gubernaculifera TaxID=47775 RepID=A0AAD3E0D9_9CHLO|nr:hypothetical protein Agub_g12542 [Astrephomene gubernaculifera]